MKVGSLFSGYGGLDIAVNAVLGTETAWFCQHEPPTKQQPNPTQAPSRILAHHYPHMPNHGDITQVDWDQVEPVDVLTGGFPCQDVSAAGKRAGLRPGTRSGMWTHMAHAINQLRPRLVVIENVRGLLSTAAHSDLEPCPWCLGDGEGVPPLRALGAVLGDLAELGYDARWHGLRASDVGAPHARFRVFVVATDTRGEHRVERRLATSVQAPPGWAFGEPAGRGRTPPPDADREGLAQRSGIRSDACQERPATLGSGAPADADGGRRRSEPGILGGLRAEERDQADRRTVVWGDYEPAIRRWEHVLGRPAPEPTEPGTKGNRRLSPAFVEWMMGLPAGWVTDVPGVKRNDQLKALGNGVVPAQAALALHHLVPAMEAAA